MSKVCPICDNKNPSFIRNKLKGNVQTDAFECADCDLHFLDTWDNVEAVKKLYEGDNYVFTHNVAKESPLKLKFDEYENRLEQMKPFLNKDMSLFEIGCGDGKYLKMVKPFVAEAEGLELSPPQVKLLREEGFTCYDVMIDEMEPPKQYDIVCMYALLEHVPNVQEFLSHLKKYVKPGGHIFIEVPNRKNVLVNGFDIEEFKTHYYRPVHLYYFTPKSLGKLLEQSGFNFEIRTFQQASITNLFHWLNFKKGQPNAQALTSVTLPLVANESSAITEALEKVDDFYREQLINANEGDLLSAHIKM
jgi:2-polyprenyl-3-methyl-5-hydroxy-6-metoxy-1,4-benzoquinol methylase